MKFVLPRRFWGVENYIRSRTQCRDGIHGSRFPVKAPINWCDFCGLNFRPEAYLSWTVTLISGETRVVKAINEHHARSVVVRGGARGRIDGNTGKPLNKVLVYEGNIIGVHLITNEVVRTLLGVALFPATVLLRDAFITQKIPVIVVSHEQSQDTLRTDRLVIYDDVSLTVDADGHGERVVVGSNNGDKMDPFTIGLKTDAEAIVTAMLAVA